MILFLSEGVCLLEIICITVIELVKRNSQLPVVLFPGSTMHIDVTADAVLFLSLISGRNPELLIGQQVIAAPILKRSNLEVLPTGYLLIDADNHTTVSYMSNTVPIPADKYSVAMCTAMAGEMLGPETNLHGCRQRSQVSN